MKTNSKLQMLKAFKKISRHRKVRPNDNIVAAYYNLLRRVVEQTTGLRGKRI